MARYVEPLGNVKGTVSDQRASGCASMQGMLRCAREFAHLGACEALRRDAGTPAVRWWDPPTHPVRIEEIEAKANEALRLASSPVPFDHAAKRTDEAKGVAAAARQVADAADAKATELLGKLDAVIARVAALEAHEASAMRKATDDALGLDARPRPAVPSSGAWPVLLVFPAVGALVIAALLVVYALVDILAGGRL